jgi:sRNA-binding protein
MASQYGIERDRGAKESWQQIEVLREKWPLAFSVKPHDIRPLAIGAAGEIAAAMGWSLPYALGVLDRWKMAPAYCRAVLSNDQRIAIDGTPAEAVDAEAKELATKQLARLAARKAATQRVPKAAELLPRRPSRRSHCATECGLRSCGGAHKSQAGRSHGE